MRVRLTYVETVYGAVEVNGNTMEECLQKIHEGHRDCDFVDYKSDYVFDDDAKATIESE